MPASVGIVMLFSLVIECWACCPPEPDPTFTTTTSETTTTFPNECTVNDSKSLETTFHQDADCGVSWNFREPRIIGGNSAEINDYPWIVSLESPTTRAFCGGTIIDKNWVLTAAHCVDDKNPADITVHFGDRDLNLTDEGELTRTPSSLYIHPLFDCLVNVDYDFALLKIDEPLNLTGWNIRKICLPSSHCDDEFCQPGDAYIAGWGDSNGAGKEPNRLQKVVIDILSQEYCKQYLGTKFTDSMTCAGSAFYGVVGTCIGDSGGPLMKTVDDRYFLCGVTSWSRGSCNFKPFPDVFARVCKAVGWIAEIMNCDQEPINGKCPA